MSVLQSPGQGTEEDCKQEPGGAGCPAQHSGREPALRRDPAGRPTGSLESDRGEHGRKLGHSPGLEVTWLEEALPAKAGQSPALAGSRPGPWGFIQFNSTFYLLLQTQMSSPGSSLRAQAS